MRIVEKRIMLKDRIRQLCMDSHLYTKGTNDEYNKMLNYASSLVNVTTENLEIIATDIYNHSEHRDPSYQIINIMWALNEYACYTDFEIVE